MLGFAIVLTVFSQAADNTIETDMQLYANPQLCRQQGAEIVERRLRRPSTTGKPVRSVWFTCQAVQGDAAGNRSAKRRTPTN